MLVHLCDILDSLDYSTKVGQIRPWYKSRIILDRRFVQLERIHRNVHSRALLLLERVVCAVKAHKASWFQSCRHSLTNQCGTMDVSSNERVARRRGDDETWHRWDLNPAQSPRKACVIRNYRIDRCCLRFACSCFKQCAGQRMFNLALISRFRKNVLKGNFKIFFWRERKISRQFTLIASGSAVY